MLASVRAALDDDLDAPTAREALDAFARSVLDKDGTDEQAGAGLKEAAELVGLSFE